MRTQSLDCPVGVEEVTDCRSAVSHNNSRPEVDDVASVFVGSVSSCSIALFFDFALLPLSSSFFSREFGGEAFRGLRSEGSVTVTQEKFVGGVDLFSSREEQKSCPSRSKTVSFCLDEDPCRRLRFSPESNKTFQYFLAAILSIITLNSIVVRIYLSNQSRWAAATVFNKLTCHLLSIVL